VAWTRLAAIALAIGLVLHAVSRAAAHVWLCEACTAVEAVAAALLLRARTRSAGVLFGVAALSLALGTAILAADFAAVPAPLLILAGLLLIARHLDRGRVNPHFAIRRWG
jgi:hypothetical protein